MPVDPARRHTPAEVAARFIHACRKTTLELERFAAVYEETSRRTRVSDDEIERAREFIMGRPS